MQTERHRKFMDSHLFSETMLETADLLDRAKHWISEVRSSLNIDHVATDSPALEYEKPSDPLEMCDDQTYETGVGGCVPDPRAVAHYTMLDHYPQSFPLPGTRAWQYVEREILRRRDSPVRQKIDSSPMVDLRELAQKLRLRPTVGLAIRHDDRT
jgi:hypothetical protein